MSLRTVVECARKSVTIVYTFVSYGFGFGE